MINWKGCGRRRSWYSSGEAEENYERPQGSVYSGLDSNLGAPEYNSEALPLEPPCMVPYAVNKYHLLHLLQITSIRMKTNSDICSERDIGVNSCYSIQMSVAILRPYLILYKDTKA